MTRHRPESELSNLLCDILVWGGKQFDEQPVFSVYNMGGIRSNLAKGKVTVGDVNDMAPFENKICFLTLTGDKVLELFQQIAHRGGEGLSSAVRMVITKEGKLMNVTIMVNLLTHRRVIALLRLITWLRATTSSWLSRVVRMCWLLSSVRTT